MKRNLEKRIEVFQKFWEKREFAGLALDADGTERLTRLLDSCAIILEGGTDFDLKILDVVEEKADDADKKKEGDKDKSDAAKGKTAAGDEQSELQKKAKEYLEAKTGGGGAAEEAKKPEGGKKRKRRGSDSDGSGDSSDDEEEAPPGMKKDEDVVKKVNSQYHFARFRKKKDCMQGPCVSRIHVGCANGLTLELLYYQGME